MMLANDLCHSLLPDVRLHGRGRGLIIYSFSCRQICVPERFGSQLGCLGPKLGASGHLWGDFRARLGCVGSKLGASRQRFFLKWQRKWQPATCTAQLSQIRLNPKCDGFIDDDMLASAARMHAVVYCL